MKLVKGIEGVSVSTYVINVTRMLYTRGKFYLLFSLLVMSNSFVTPWTVARQAHLSMGFSRQEYWSGWPFSSPGDLPDPEIEPTCLAGGFFTTEPPGKPMEIKT